MSPVGQDKPNVTPVNSGGGTLALVAPLGCTPRPVTNPPVATCRSNREIAAQLSLSVHTIEGHLDRIYTKLGVHARGQLIAGALAEATTRAGT